MNKWATSQYTYLDSLYSVNNGFIASNGMFKLDTTYLICGLSSADTLYGNYSYQINNNGDILFSTFNDSEGIAFNWDCSYSLLFDSGFVYASGTKFYQGIPGWSKVRLFNSAGEQLWNRNFFYENDQDTSYSNFHAVAQLPDSSILVLGALGLDGSGVGGGSEYWNLSCVCLDLDGNTIWIKLHDLGINGFSPSGLYYQESEYVLVCGGLASYTDEFGLNMQHSIKKLNYACDTILQEYTWGGWCSEDSPVMIKMSNGNYMVAYEECYDNLFGYPNYPDYSDRKFKIHLMEFNPISMTPMWEGEYFSNAINDETWFSDLKVTDIASTNDGGYLISFTQFANDGNYPGSSSSILKVNEDREQEWFKTFSYSLDGADISRLYSVEEAFDGGVISTGFVKLDLYPSRQWVLKLDACGDVEYNGCDFVSALEIPQKEEYPILIYPNPAGEICHVVFSDQIQYFVLRDLMGKEVFTENVMIQREIDVDVSTLSSGIYLIECGDGEGGVWTEKVVVE
jgi:hypothetical protein